MAKGLSGKEEGITMILKEENEDSYICECPDCTYITTVKK